MQTYKFDSNTKEYLYAEEAFRDPLESKAQGRDVWLLPADSTFTAPLEPKDGHAVCWNGKAWEYKEDHRQKRDGGGVIIEGTGTPYWLKGDTWESPARYMMELGPLPEGAMLEKPEKPASVVAEEELAKAKAARAAAVAALAVEVDGMVFDGDENAMRRMSNALTAAQSADVDNWRTVTVPWVLADNTVVTVTMGQLARALRGAMEAMAKLWVLPYS